MSLPENNLISPAALNIFEAERETDVSLSGTAAVSAALGSSKSGLSDNGRQGGGIFDIKSDVDCFIKVAYDPSGVTTTNGYPLLAGNVVELWVPHNCKIGAITSGGTGTLMIHRSKRV